MLMTELKHYFPDVTSVAYIGNPVHLPVRTEEQEKLTDIQADEGAKTKHKECSPINLRVSTVSSYLMLACHAVPHLLIFPSTWECEQMFSAMLTIKSKSWSHFAVHGHDF